MLTEKKFPSGGVLKESYSRANKASKFRIEPALRATSHKIVTDKFYHTLCKTSSSVKQILFQLILRAVAFDLHLKGISANIHVLSGHPTTVTTRRSRRCNLGLLDLFL